MTALLVIRQPMPAWYAAVGGVLVVATLACWVVLAVTRDRPVERRIGFATWASMLVAGSFLLMQAYFVCEDFWGYFNWMCWSY